MSLIQNYGSPNNPIWVITGEPYEKDANFGTIFSCGYGYNWKKVWKLSTLPEAHIRSLRPCLGASYQAPNILSNLVTDLELYKPTFIIVLTDEILNYLVPETAQQKEKNSSIRKWAGSLLQCRFLNYPHYIAACQPPDFITRNWDYHEIAGLIDLGKVANEYEFFTRYGSLNPLPNRQLLTSPNYSDLISYLNDCLSCKIVSIDIETIRPKKGTEFYDNRHPGYPYTIALAKSIKEGMSFSLWDYTSEQTIKMWRLVNEISSSVATIGQNYYSFDAQYLARLGFYINLAKIHDTLIRHHILWPGLPHSLQFQTKHYTREPFYKDENAGFNWKYYKDKIMKYNAKDACVTMEIYYEQEKEFDERPWLR